MHHDVWTARTAALPEGHEENANECVHLVFMSTVVVSCTYMYCTSFKKRNQSYDVDGGAAYVDAQLDGHGYGNSYGCLCYGLVFMVDG